MRRTLHLPLRLFSINSYYYANKAWITPEAREWVCHVFAALNSETNLKAMEDLRNHFDPKEHAYSVSLLQFYPKDKLITKKDIISSKSLDLSNVEKPIIDLIFLSKHAEKECPYGAQNLMVDDKFIIDLNSRKRISPENNYRTEIEIEILELRTVEEHVPFSEKIQTEAEIT